MDGYTSLPGKPITLGDDETVDNVNFTVKGDKIIPDGITGNSEFFAGELKIYPNPFEDAVRISLPPTPSKGGGEYVLQIINASGTMVHKQTITGDDEIIRLVYMKIINAYS